MLLFRLFPAKVLARLNLILLAFDSFFENPLFHEDKNAPQSITFFTVVFETHAINRKPQTSFQQRWLQYVRQTRPYSYCSFRRAVPCCLYIHGKIEITAAVKLNSRFIFRFHSAQLERLSTTLRDSAHLPALRQVGVGETKTDFASSMKHCRVQRVCSGRLKRFSTCKPFYLLAQFSTSNVNRSVSVRFTDLFMPISS